MRVVLLITFIFFSIMLFGQKFGERSRYEKRWAFFHPLAALKVRKIYKLCLPHYEELQKSKALDGYKNGGKLDAFRHVFFMAAFSQKIKIRKLRKLGIAHEKGNYAAFLKDLKEDNELADSLSNEMDLKNNELGFKIGSANKKKDLKDLKDMVIEGIKKGEAFYFKRNSKGDYLTCSGEIINLELYKNKWFIPKCLITTDL
jgi:hypothetical protein